MKKCFLIVLITILFTSGWAQNGINWQPNHAFDSYFREAYEQFPNVRRGLLEAISWTNTRMRNIQPDQEAASCMGIPQVVGPMGLYVGDTTLAFVPRARMLAAMGWEDGPETNFWDAEVIEERMQDPRAQIMSCANFYEKLLDLSTGKRQQHQISWEAALELSGISSLGDDYARGAFLYSLEAFLEDPGMQAEYGFAPLNESEKLVKYVGEENYRVLSAKTVTLTAGQARAANGAVWTPLPDGIASSDYPPAIWDPAPSCNWSSRSGTAVSAVTIHTIQGSYAGAINWFKNCSSNVTAHYVIRSFDGQVTQMVLESDKAWHVGTENPYTIGLEHEGYVSDASWYTNEMYNSSADLVRDIVNSGYGIDPLKTYFGPPHSGVTLIGQNCYRIKGHQHYPNQSHTDPGINWDWDRFYRLLNGNMPTSPTTYTACSGNFYDGGGSGNNYGNQERRAWIIAPAGAATATLTFSSFNTEAGYDYLYVYNGDSPQGELLGKFDGTTVPPALTSTSGKFYLEFRSDCATTAPGWAATWSCSTTAPACGSPVAQAETNVSGMAATLNWSAVSGATSYEVRYRHHLETTWTTLSTTNTNYRLTGLAATSLYHWQVRALCAANAGNWVGDTLSLPLPVNETYTSCTGTLNDAGGTIGNYRNNENYVLTIAPPGAGSVTLNFTAFELESNYDFLYIYDGPNTGSTLIGTYSGTSSPGTITSSGGSITLKFTSDTWTTKSGWEATWTCASNLAPNTAISPIPEWVADDFTANFTDTDNSGTGIDQRFYQVLEYADTMWQANRGNGFLFETFDHGFANWSLTSGYAYILNNRLHHTDTVNTNSNTYIDVTQDNSGAWLYNFSGRLWSGNTNRRFGIHFFVDNPTAPNRGNSYLVWFRGDNQTVEIYETVNDVLNRMVIQSATFGDYVWYDFKITYDPSTGVIDVFQEDNLIATWTDPTPLQTGTYVSLRTNQAHCDYENVRVFKERGTSETIKVGPAVTEDARYMSPNPTVWAGQVHAISRDNADNWSNMDFKSFKVDWTPPTDITISDGTGADIDTSFSTTQIAANWTTSIDTNSGIETYWLALGSAPGADDIVSWTSVGDTTTELLNGLSLTHNNFYYLSVRSENLSGLYCTDATSDGFRVWAPTTELEPEQSSEWIIYPNPAQNSFTLKSTFGPKNIQVWDNQGRLIFKREMNDESLNISVANWAVGMYQVVLIRDGEREVKRLVVE